MNTLIKIMNNKINLNKYIIQFRIIIKINNQKVNLWYNYNQINFK
jgi:hypothetical protein